MKTHREEIASLKGRPWCSGALLMVEDRGDNNCEPLLYRPQCGRCGGGLGGFPNRAEAIAAWNRRADPLVEEDPETAASIEYLRNVVSQTRPQGMTLSNDVRRLLAAYDRAREALALPVGNISACTERAGEEPDGSFAGEAQSQSEDELYRGFRIYYDPPPIPTRECDWHWVHDEYDGPEDNRCGHAPSLEAAKAEVDFWHEESGQ